MRNLIDKVKGWQSRSMTVGLCHGCFDVIHYGHIQHFQYAKNICDVLVVSMTTSRHIEKGFNRPYFSDNARQGVLKSIKEIDYVYISKEKTAESILRDVGFDYYFKGIDYKDKSDPRIQREVEAMHKSTQLIITPTPKMSSTDAINALNLIKDK